MTDEMTENVEDLKEETRRATERMSVAGSDLIKTVQSLLREAAVRRITIQDKTGRTLIEIPLYAGVIGALFVGSWTVLALIAAWFAEVSILIERDNDDADAEPTVVGEAVERAAGTAAEAARSAAATAKSGLGAALGGAAHAAGGLARRAADAIEGRLSQADADADMARGQEAAEAIIAAAAAQSAEPQRCIALTKSGERCKRTAAAGSAYCGTHQPK